MRGRVSEWLPASLSGSPLPGRPPFLADVGLDFSSEAPISPPSVAEVRACARERIARERAARPADRPRGRLHPAGFGVLDPALLAAADPETASAPAVASRLVSRRVALSGQDGAAGPAAELRDAGAAAGTYARRLPFRTVAGPAARLARIGRSRGSDRARTGRRSALGPALCRLALAASSRRGHLGYLGQYAGAAPEGGFEANTAASDPFRAARVLGCRGASLRCPISVMPGPVPPVLPQLLFRPVKPLTPPSFTVV